MKNECVVSYITKRESLILISAYIDAYASVCQCSMYGAPQHRWVKSPAPWVGSIDDGLMLTEACQVLATYIDREIAEPACDLCAQLLL